MARLLGDIISGLVEVASAAIEAALNFVARRLGI
jgi:hypothetical protein